MSEKGKEITSIDLRKIIMFCFPKVAFKHYALLELKKLVKVEESKKIWNKTLEKQKKLAENRPNHSLGTNHLLRYMEWDCALYFVLKEQEFSESCAKELIEKINWSIFAATISLIFYFSRFRSHNLLVRVNWIINLMFIFVFTAPFERRKHSNPNEVAFDVVSCPLAKYFKQQGVIELTSVAACSLDQHMANLWGVMFTRFQTIAQGYTFCDFHFHLKPITLYQLNKN